MSSCLLSHTTIFFPLCCVHIGLLHMHVHVCVCVQANPGCSFVSVREA